MSREWQRTIVLVGLLVAAVGYMIFMARIQRP